MAFTNNKAQHDTSKDQKKEAEVYLNPGLTIENPVTGEEQFVSLPWGVPVDTQAFSIKNTSDEAYNAMQVAKSKLLEGLQKRAEQLDPEEEIIIPLQLVMRRRKAPISKEQINETSSAQLEDFFTMINGTPKKETEENTSSGNPFEEMFAKAS